MDENFLSRFGVEDEDELRENIADSLEGRLEQQKRSRMSEQIQDYLLENTDFELPEDIITEQAGTIFQRQCFNLMRQGLSREELEEKTEQLKASSEEQAKEQLRKFFIMDKVADQLDIEVAEEELNGYIAQMAMQQNQRPEKMREQLAQQGRLDQLRMEIRDEKAVSQLLEWAEVTETDTEEKPEENSEETTNESTEESENSDEA
jgi:trigger factor